MTPETSPPRAPQGETQPAPKRCPFCGFSPRTIAPGSRGNARWQVWCARCGVKGPSVGEHGDVRTEAEAVDLWNEPRGRFPGVTDEGPQVGFNGSLLAAAKYAELALTAFIVSGNSVSLGMRQAVIDLRAAIAKAEGKEQTS